MRTPIIIITFLAVILLLTACNKSEVPSDTAIQQMIVGTWNGNDVEVTFRPDFSWHDNDAQGLFDGQWRVDSGFLIMTITKYNNQTSHNRVLHYKVISIDKQYFVHGMDERDGNKAYDDIHIRWFRKMPNKSPEPNPSGALGESRTPVAHLISGSGWLGFGR